MFDEAHGGAWRCGAVFLADRLAHLCGRYEDSEDRKYAQSLVTDFNDVPVRGCSLSDSSSDDGSLSPQPLMIPPSHASILYWLSLPSASSRFVASTHPFQTLFCGNPSCTASPINMCICRGLSWHSTCTRGVGSAGNCGRLTILALTLTCRVLRGGDQQLRPPWYLKESMYGDDETDRTTFQVISPTVDSSPPARAGVHAAYLRRACCLEMPWGRDALRP